MKRNHPKRSVYDLTLPAPATVAAAREALGLNQADAAKLVHVTTDSWARWESDPANTRHRQMPVMAWELFQRKTKHMRPPMSESELAAWEKGSNRVGALR